MGAIVRRGAGGILILLALVGCSKTTNTVTPIPSKQPPTVSPSPLIEGEAPIIPSSSDGVLQSLPPRSTVAPEDLAAYDAFVKLQAASKKADQRLKALKRANERASDKAKKAGDRYKKGQMSYTAYGKIYDRSSEAYDRYLDAYDVAFKLSGKLSRDAFTLDKLLATEGAASPSPPGHPVSLSP